jgi:hypothetical protein
MVREIFADSVALAECHLEEIVAPADLHFSI